VSTFTLFPLLPIELQTQIWIHAISHSPTRLIPISVFQTPTSNPPSHSTKNNIYTTSASIPGALHACQESRCVSLERWGLSIEEPGQLFFDVNTDILFLGHSVENNTEFSRIGEDWDQDVVDRSDTQAGRVRMVERMWEDDIVDGLYRTPGLGREDGEGDVDCDNVEWTKIAKGKGWVFTAGTRQFHVREEVGRTFKSWVSIGVLIQLEGEMGNSIKHMEYDRLFVLPPRL
jgi:hypothetical protein